MNFKEFSTASNLTEVSEVDKATLLAFYLLKKQDVKEISLAELRKYMLGKGLGNPNPTRFRQNIASSRRFMNATGNNVQLRLKTIHELDIKYPELSHKSEEIVSDETILPETLYLGTRGYLITVAKQLNACYGSNLFDGCALLMRRLIEMLLILTYRELGKEGEIKDSSGGYHSLSKILDYSAKNKILNLTKGSQDTIDTFRKMGNYSAHSLEYSARKADIDRVKIEFRVCVEELLHKCGLKK